MHKRVDGITRMPVHARRVLYIPARGAAVTGSAEYASQKTIAHEGTAQNRHFRYAKRLAATAHRFHLIERVLARELERKTRRRQVRLLVGRVFVAAVVLASMYVTYDTWHTNQLLRTQLKAGDTAVAAVNNTDTATAQDRQQAEGRDEKQPSGDWIEKYAVAPDLPRVLTIQRINVKARILPMSVNNDGSMQSPVNIYDAGWYTGGVRPGDKGAAVIDAHASGLTRMGLFAYLDTLKPGDNLMIEKGDGTKLNYQVVETKKVARDKLDMKELLTAKGGEEGLNLITCAGTWQQQGQTYSDRALVFTKRI